MKGASARVDSLRGAGARSQFSALARGLEYARSLDPLKAQRRLRLRARLLLRGGVGWRTPICAGGGVNQNGGGPVRCAPGVVLLRLLRGHASRQAFIYTCGGCGVSAEAWSAELPSGARAGEASYVR